MSLRTLALVTLGCAALAACNAPIDDSDGRPVEPCGDGGLCFVVEPPYSGVATLKPHTTETDYLGSVISFEYATTVDADGEVNNDWDLSLDSTELNFRVNTVTDDISWIVDLGPLNIEAVPATLDRNDYPTGADGTHDFVPAVLEHVYLVHTFDTNSRQYAAFRVVGLEPGASVTLQWFRSTESDRFVFPRGKTL